MKVNEFVDGFKKANDKEKYVRKHIVNTYIPYAEKITECKRIANVSMYRLDEKGVRHLSIDTPTRYMLFIVTIVKKYTDIEFDSENVLDGFDALNNDSIDGVIISLIGDDFDIFKSVFDMVINDVLDRERNIINYFDNKIDSFIHLLESLDTDFIERGVINNVNDKENGHTGD